MDASPSPHDIMTLQAADKVLKLWQQCDKIDTLFVLFCATTCFLVVPGIGLAYSGYSVKANGLSSYYPSLLALIVVSIQWWIWGYSLAFSTSNNGVIGDLSFAFHRDVNAQPIGSIPAILFSFFQMVFCATVCAMSVGGAAERARLLPLIPFIFCWASFVYCPLAHMVWAEGGFLADLGVLDFAGGTPVHICSGASATALSVYLSHPLFRSRKSSKRTPSHIKLHKPHNITNMLLAMIIIWSCWLPFESGTALALNFKAVMAFCVANIAAASGAATWACLTYLQERVWSLDATMLGMLAGLVMITPAGGFVGMQGAFFLGIIGATLIRQMLRFKMSPTAENVKWVDPADVFATHAFGGVCATLLTGIFASRQVAAYDGATDIPGGVLIDRHYKQFGIQMVEGIVGLLWSFGVSYIIIAAIDCIPGFEVLSTDEDMMKGMDAAQMAESLSGAHASDEDDYQPYQRSIQL